MDQRQRDDYQKRIRAMRHPAIVELWERVLERDVADWGKPGTAFEYLILRAFEIEGAQVEWPFEVCLFDPKPEEEIDGAIYSSGLSCLVESKDYDLSKTKVGPDPIQRLRSQLLRRPAGTLGIVFTSSEFSDAAITVAHFAPPQTVLLWGRTQIDFCLRRRAMCRALLLKYRYAVERGDPDYNPREAMDL